jgi:hypothetical protein
MRFGDTPERKIREWVAKRNKTTGLRGGEKGRIQGDCIGHGTVIFVEGRGGG